MIYDSEKITVKVNGVKVQPLSELTEEQKKQRKSPDVTVTARVWQMYGLGIIKQDGDK